MIGRIITALVTIVVLMAGVLGYRAMQPERETYTVTADLEQAPNLFEGGRVTVRGVEVGDIVDVEPTTDGVRVTMEIEESVKVPADATLSVVPITVIADRYVQLFPAYTSGPRLQEGDHLPLSRTAIPAELDDVLTQLKGLLSALEPKPGEKRGPMARLIVSLDEALAGRSRSLAGTLSGSAAVLGNLARSESDITGLIQNVDRLFVALANRSSEIGIVNERFALVAEALLGDQQNLEGTLENLSLLAGEASGLIEESGESLGESFGRLGKVLRVVLRHQDELSEGIRWSNVISQALGATDAQGRGLYAYSGRQAPPGTPESAYNYRLDSRDTITCERIEVTTDVLLAILPEADINDVMDTMLSYIPDEYDPHLAFLLRQLIPLCTHIQDVPAATPEVTSRVQELIARVGEERFKEMLVRWLAEGLAGEAR